MNNETTYTMPYWLLGKTMRELMLDIMVNDKETPQKRISTIALNDYLHQCANDETIKQLTWLYTDTQPDYVEHLDYSAIAVVNFINELLTKNPIPYEPYNYEAKENTYRKIANLLIRYVETISDTECAKPIRISTATKMRGMLVYLVMDTNLNTLTSIYRNTKPESSINVGYDPLAVTKFIVEFNKQYHNETASKTSTTCNTQKQF